MRGKNLLISNPAIIAILMSARIPYTTGPNISIMSPVETLRIQ
jgi:hypothetical protein